jgi:hypothetical protein
MGALACGRSPVVQQQQLTGASTVRASKPAYVRAEIVVQHGQQRALLLSWAVTARLPQPDEWSQGLGGSTPHASQGAQVAVLVRAQMS